MSNPDDICANRHGGNPQSVAAYLRSTKNALNHKTRIIVACEGLSGITCREMAELLGVGMNVISGRFSELKKAGVIHQDGTREGCAVYKLSIPLS